MCGKTMESKAANFYRNDMTTADTHFVIRGVWDSTDCVQLHVVTTFQIDAIMKTESVKDLIICVS